VKLRTFTTMQLALGASLAVHAALLTVRFVDPQRFNRVFEDSPLEVILVNARTNDKPDKAQALAQADMAGGGELDRGRASSPLPASALATCASSAISSTDSTLTMLRMITNLPATLPIPWMKSARMRAPKEGGGSISLPGISITSETASTMMPMSWRKSFSPTSTMTMQLRLPI